jgi:hypothetical protein
VLNRSLWRKIYIFHLIISSFGKKNYSKVVTDCFFGLISVKNVGKKSLNYVCRSKGGKTALISCVDAILAAILDISLPVEISLWQQAFSDSGGSK